MTFTQWLITYVAAFAAFLAIDLVWLGIVARKLYRSQMGDLLTDQFNWPVAMGFYALFIVGVLYFVIDPAIAADSWTIALRNGAMFGLLTYATYDLTALAVIRGWPTGLAFIDIAWGVVLTTSVSSAAFATASALR